MSRHNYIVPLLFAAAAGAALFNWAMMPRWETSKNVGTRQRRLAFLFNIDRNLSLVAFVVFAALALASIFIGDGAAE